MNIQEHWLKIKAVGESALGEWGLIAIILMLGAASFGLGRFSALEESMPPVSVKEAPKEAKPHGMYPGGLIVASRAGSVYYFPWCAGASKIAVVNQVWFQSEADARKSGYNPSKSCKGLQ